MTIFDKIKNIPESVQINIVGSLCVIVFFLIILSPVIYVAITGSTSSVQKQDRAKEAATEIVLTVKYPRSEQWIKTAIPIGSSFSHQFNDSANVSVEASFVTGATDNQEKRIDGSHISVACNGHLIFEAAIKKASHDLWAAKLACDGKEIVLSRGIQLIEPNIEVPPAKFNILN